MERQSRDEKKHVTKDVVGLLLGEVVSTRKNTSSQRMYVVGLLVGDSKNDSLTKMKTF